MNLLALAFILSVFATQAYSTSFCLGGDDCCSPNGYTCSLGEGDCDKDADCKDGMFCGKNNCLTDVKGFGKGLGQNTGKQAIKKGLRKFTFDKIHFDDADDCCMQKRWRADRRCGKGWFLSDGKTPAICDPDAYQDAHGYGPCCSDENYCGNTDAHCKCPDCIDYSRDTSCVHRDAIFTDGTIKQYDVTSQFCQNEGPDFLGRSIHWLQGENCGFEGMTLQECQQKCATAESRFGGCTHFMYYENSAINIYESRVNPLFPMVPRLYVPLPAFVNYLNRHGHEGTWNCRDLSCSAEKVAPLSSCYLFHGPMKMKKNSQTKIKKFGVVVGPALCDKDKKKLRETAKAKWVNLQTCDASTAVDPMTCTYKKATGIGRSKSKTKSVSKGLSYEFGIKVGFEGELFDMKTTLETSMSAGETYEWSNESTNTFEETANTENVATFTVSPGRISTICQPQGYVGDFVVYAAYFKRVEGKNCPE